MAEIYKQQIEHNASGGTMLRSAPFKNYYKQSMEDVEEGFRKLDQELQYLGDKELAAKMEAVAQAADEKIESWQDFNTDGRNELKAQIADMWDQALSETSLAAQKRFGTANPEAKKIFELKQDQKILKKAHDQVYNERLRDVNAYADMVASVRDPKRNEEFFREALNDFNNDMGGMLNVQDLSKLSDELGYAIAEQSIATAIIEGRDKDAEAYLNNPFYLRYLGPSDKTTLRRQLVSLRKSIAEDNASGGNYKEIANMLIAGRDAAMMAYGTTKEGRLAVDEDYNKFVTALKNGESIQNLTIGGRPFSDFLTENSLEAAAYWDSLPPTTRQLAVNNYEETVSKAYGTDYKDRQTYLATAFMNSLPEPDENGNYDFTNMSNNSMRETLALAEDLRGSYSVGLDSSVKKIVSSFYAVAEAKRLGAAKAASYEYDPVQQEMAGFTAGKTFLGGGNLTESMVRAQQAGDPRPSVIDGMLKNMSRPTNMKASDMSSGGSYESFGEGLTAAANVDLNKIGETLGTGDLATQPSDSIMFYDNGKENAEAISASVGSLMREMGEVNTKGKLVAPKANTYRYMTYAIPVILSYISVKGNEADFEATGIRPGVINGLNTVDLVTALQNRYSDVLDEQMPSGGAPAYSSVGRTPLGVPAPAIKGVQDSTPYQMLQDAMAIAKSRGWTDFNKEPDVAAMISVGSVLNSLVTDSTAITRVPANSSGAKKRIDAKTKPMFQFKEK